MPRDLVIKSEREAWGHVQRLAHRLTTYSDGVPASTVRTIGDTLEEIAKGMLAQLYAGVHVNGAKAKGATKGATKANPTLLYARSIGGRIRSELEGTKAATLAHSVTHAMMEGRLDKVTPQAVQLLVNALESHGHSKTAAQLTAFWNRRY